MPEENKDTEKDLDFENLMDNPDELNKLMDLDSLESEENKVKTEQLADKNINEEISDLNDLDLDIESDEPEVTDVEKLAEELEKKVNENKPNQSSSNENIKNNIPEENESREPTSEGKKSVVDETVETIPEVDLDESELPNDIPELELDEENKEPESNEPINKENENVVEESVPEVDLDESELPNDIPELELDEENKEPESNEPINKENENVVEKSVESIPEVDMEDSNLTKDVELEEKNNIESSNIKEDIINTEDVSEMLKNENASQKLEEDIIIPNIKINSNSNEYKINSLETRLNNKLKLYEEKIEKLEHERKNLIKEIKTTNLKTKTLEKGIISLLNNLLLIALGDTTSILSSILEIKKYLEHSKENIEMLINITETLKEKLPEESLYAIYHILGNLYVDISNYSAAEKNYLRALELCEGNKSFDMQFNVSVIQNNLGTLYSEMNKNENARKYFELSLNIRRKLSEKAKEKYQLYLFYTLNNIGVLEINSGNLDKAESYLIEAFNLKDSIKNLKKSDEAMILFNLGTLYSEKVENEKAVEYFEKSYKLYKDLYEIEPLNYEEKLKKIINILLNYYSEDPQKYNSLIEELENM